MHQAVKFGVSILASPRKTKISNVLLLCMSDNIHTPSLRVPTDLTHINIANLDLQTGTMFLYKSAYQN